MAPLESWPWNLRFGFMLAEMPTFGSSSLESSLRSPGSEAAKLRRLGLGASLARLFDSICGLLKSCLLPVVAGRTEGCLDMLPPESSVGNFKVCLEPTGPIFTSFTSGSSSASLTSSPLRGFLPLSCSIFSVVSPRRGDFRAELGDFMTSSVALTMSVSSAGASGAVTPNLMLRTGTTTEPRREVGVGSVLGAAVSFGVAVEGVALTGETCTLFELVA
mmetsp:Transcript_27086/g.59453  ORF Transcript_27086/g.59453 Transcript_27086/m.59453 type:complete len:218 (-) Transcript_27086:1994-2647(-)